MTSGGPENPTGTPTDRTVDAWYYDLGLVASRVEQNHEEALANRARTRQLARQARVIAAFSLFAMVVLGYRSEVNARNIAADEYQACVGGRQIIDTYNALQNELAAIDRDTPGLPPEILQRRTNARMRYLIPSPECER